MPIAKIKDLRVRPVIGVYDWERELKQDLLINILIEYDGDRAAKTDDINDTINYLALANEIIDKVEKTEFNLLEKLVDFVLDIIMEKEIITHAKVEVDKPNAIFSARSVSITSERNKC